MGEPKKKKIERAVSMFKSERIERNNSNATMKKKYIYFLGENANCITNKYEGKKFTCLNLEEKKKKKKRIKRYEPPIQSIA
jgi:hypothetical protein